MKKVLFSMAFGCCMFFGGQASAASCNMAVCASTFQNGKYCKYTYSSCNCQSNIWNMMGPNYYAAYRSSCLTGETDMGQVYFNGVRRCCAVELEPDADIFEQLKNIYADEELESALKQTISDLNGSQVETVSGNHYGYINGVLKSPSNGRGSADFAKLDICGGGHGTVDGWSNAQNCCDGTASNCDTSATTLCENNFPGSCLRK